MEKPYIPKIYKVVKAPNGQRVRINCFEDPLIIEHYHWGCTKLQYNIKHGFIYEWNGRHSSSRINTPEAYTTEQANQTIKRIFESREQNMKGKTTPEYEENNRQIKARIKEVSDKYGLGLIVP